MLSLRELLRNYLDYYRRGGVRYSLQNDEAILRAIESVLRKQFETPQVLLSHIEAALGEQTRELRQSVEWDQSVKQLKEALQQVEDLRLEIGRLPGRPSRLEELADSQLLRNPELALLGHLAAYSKSNFALDIGASTGNSTQALLDAGYTVVAFEPHPQSHQKLIERFAETKDFTAFDIAIGAADGNAKLNLGRRSPNKLEKQEAILDNSSQFRSDPEVSKFSGAVDVQVRSLESLARSGEIPAELGAVKIATGGTELDVIRGLGGLRPTVIAAKFRSEGENPGRSKGLASLPNLVREVRGLGYTFNLSVFRIGSLEKLRFLSNSVRAPGRSGGEVFFFAETWTFEKALNWCDVFL
jgi:FkbM family methyltransferase